MTLQGINWGIVTWASPLHNYLFKITQNPHKIGLSEAVFAIEDIRYSLYGIYYKIVPVVPLTRIRSASVQYILAAKFTNEDIGDT